MHVVRPILLVLVAGTVLQSCTTFGRLHGERCDVTLTWSKYSSPLEGLAIYDGFKKAMNSTSMCRATISATASPA